MTKDIVTGSEIPPIRELRAICQATAPNPARESFTGRFSRIFSMYTTALFLRTRFTPNQITVISVLTFYVGVCLFIPGNYWLNIAGALVIFLSIIFDGSDGEVARFRKKYGKSYGLAGGIYSEPVSHDIQYGFEFMILGAALYSQGFSPWFMMLGALAGTMKLMYRFLETRYWALVHGVVSDVEREELKAAYYTQPIHKKLFFWVNKNIFSSTGVFLTIFILAITDRIDLYIWLYAIGFTLLALALFIKQTYYISKNIIETVGGEGTPPGAAE
jgi:hypothetical protein